MRDRRRWRRKSFLDSNKRPASVALPHRLRRRRALKQNEQGDERQITAAYIASHLRNEDCDFQGRDRMPSVLDSARRLMAGSDDDSKLAALFLLSKALNSVPAAELYDILDWDYVARLLSYRETTADVELEDLWTLGLNILYPFIMDESELLNTAKLQSLLRPLCDLLTLPMSDSLKLDIFRCLARLAYTEPGAERLADPGLVSGLASTLAGNCQLFFPVCGKILVSPYLSFDKHPASSGQLQAFLPPLAEAFRTDASETKWEYMDVLTRCLEMSSPSFVDRKEAALRVWIEPLMDGLLTVLSHKMGPQSRHPVLRLVVSLVNLLGMPALLRLKYPNAAHASRLLHLVFHLSSLELRYALDVDPSKPENASILGTCLAFLEQFLGHLAKSQERMEREEGLSILEATGMTAEMVGKVQGILKETMDGVEDYILDATKSLTVLEEERSAAVVACTKILALWLLAEVPEPTPDSLKKLRIVTFILTQRPETSSFVAPVISLLTSEDEAYADAFLDAEALPFLLRELVRQRGTTSTTLAECEWLWLFFARANPMLVGMFLERLPSDLKTELGGMVCEYLRQFDKAMVKGRTELLELAVFCLYLGRYTQDGGRLLERAQGATRCVLAVGQGRGGKEAGTHAARMLALSEELMRSGV